MRRLLFRTVLALAALVAAPAHAATIVIDVEDGFNEGFNDPTAVAPIDGNTATTRGGQRLRVFQEAAAIWGARLTSNVTIKVAAKFDPDECSNSGAVLGSAGAFTYFAYGPTEPIPSGARRETWYTVAQFEAMEGSNQNGTDPEIEANFNTRIDDGCFNNERWYYGIDLPQTGVPANRVALLPVVLHELAHGLGFLTVTCTEPTGCGTGYPAGSFLKDGFGVPVPDIWTYFLRNFATSELWVDMTNAERATSARGDPNLVWNGANVTAGIPASLPSFSGTQGSGSARRVRMYAPLSHESGSSVSHFTDAASPDQLMEPAIGDVFDNVELTLALLRDLGWGTSSGGGSVNQAPTITAPASIAVPEDTATTLSGIVFNDADAGTLNMVATFGVTGGTLAASPQSGVSFSAVTTKSVTATGSRANLNLLVSQGRLVYTPVSDSTAADSLDVTINDNGNTGSGGPKTASRTIPLSITAANDAPTINVPTTLPATEDVALPIDTLTFGDVDAGGATVSLTASVSGGELDALSTGSVTVTGGGSLRVLSGTIPSLQVYLSQDRLTFRAAPNSTTNVTLSVTISDNGNTGSGGTRTATDAGTITIAAVNDAPTIVAPAVSVTEDTLKPLTTVAFADVDAGTSIVTATFTADAGALEAVSSGGVTVTGADAFRQLAGTVAAINAFLSQGQLGYRPVANATAPASLAVAISDGGNTGSGGTKTANANVALAIAAVNDAPTLNAPASIAVSEDVPVSLGSIALGDVDAGTGTLTVTYSVGDGALEALSSGGVVVTGGSAMRILQGTLASLTSYLAAGNLVYVTTPNGTASTTLAVSIGDGGNTGSGGTLSASANVALDVTAVNDAPALFAPTLVAIPDAAPKTLVGFGLADVDAGSASVSLTLSVTDGMLVALPAVGVTIAGSGTSQVALSGSVADLDAYLDGANLSFVQDLDPDPLVTLTALASDEGNTGTGGTRTAQRTVTLDASVLFVDEFE